MEITRSKDAALHSDLIALLAKATYRASVLIWMDDPDFEKSLQLVNFQGGNFQGIWETGRRRG